MQLQRRLDHRGFRAVDHQRRIHRTGETADHLVHLRHLVAADEGGADIQAVGTLADLLAAHGDAAVPVGLFLQFAPFLRAIGIATLADGEEGVFLPQGDGLIQRGDGGHPDRLARDGGRAEAAAFTEHRVQRLDMRDGGAAAAADQVHAVLGHEPFHPAGHFLGAKGIAGLAVHQFRQTGIRLHRQQARPVGGEPADMLGHFLRAGGTVQAHQRHIQRFDHRGGGGDIGADQQRAGGFHRDLHEDRRIGAGRRAGDLGAVHRGLDLQRVLAGLDQDRVHAAGDQATALLGEPGFQRVVVDIAERRQLGARPDAADHIAVPAIGEGFRRFPRQFGGDLVDLERAVRQTEFAERDRGGAERVGLHHVRAGFEIAAMNLPDQIGAGQTQHVGAVFLAPIIRLDIEGQRLHARTHAAVAEQNLITQGVKQMGTGHDLSFRQGFAEATQPGLAPARGGGRARCSSASCRAG